MRVYSSVHIIDKLTPIISLSGMEPPEIVAWLPGLDVTPNDIWLEVNENILEWLFL